MGTEREAIAKYDEELVEIDLKGFFILLWQKKWIIISLVIIAIIASYFISDLMTKVYESSTMIMIKDSGAENVLGEDFSFVSGHSSKSATYRTMMKSRMVLDRVIKEAGLYNEEGKALKANTVGNMITITESANTNLMNIMVQYSDPVKARDIANTLVEVLIEENKKINSLDMNSALSFINNQLESVENELDRLETGIITAEVNLRNLKNRNIVEQEDLPAKEQELLRLEREKSVAESLYLILKERKEEIQIQQTMQSTDIVVVDTAVVSNAPIKPRKSLNMTIAVVLAVFMGLLIIFLQYYFDTTIKEDEDIKRLTGLTVIGIIPDIGKIDHRQGYGVDR